MDALADSMRRRLGLVALFLAIYSLYLFAGHWDSSDAYAAYVRSPRIGPLYGVAILNGIALAAIAYKKDISLKWVIALTLVAAALPWLEIYLGTTFYYGEVRDKQDLPNRGVLNYGIVGSGVFLGLLAYQLRLPAAARIALGFAVIAVAWILGPALADVFRYRQS